MQNRIIHGYLMMLLVLGLGWFFLRPGALPIPALDGWPDLWEAPAQSAANMQSALMDAKFAQNEGRRLIELWQQNQREEAIAECSRLIEEGDDNGCALLWRARLLASQGKTEDALADLDGVLDVRPGDAAAGSLRTYLATTSALTKARLAAANDKLPAAGVFGVSVAPDQSNGTDAML